MPLKSQVLLIISNFAFNALFIGPFLPAGIALSSSVSEFLVCLFLIINLHRRYLPLPLGRWLKSFAVLLPLAGVGNYLCLVGMFSSN